MPGLATRPGEKSASSSNEATTACNLMSSQRCSCGTSVALQGWDGEKDPLGRGGNCATHSTGLELFGYLRIVDYAHHAGGARSTSNQHTGRYGDQCAHD